jgi:DNA-binding transcriptional ArsR family regulator
MPEQPQGHAIANALREPAEVRLGKAIAHPIRLQILGLLGKRPMASVEIAPLVDREVSNVAYHVRVLLQLGCIEEVDSERVRGSVKTTYRARAELLDDRHFSVASIELDRVGLIEVSDVLAKALNRVLEIEGEAVKRSPNADERIRATVGILNFESSTA